ncbi:MAG: sulfate permease [Bacteroidota bacterium]
MKKKHFLRSLIPSLEWLSDYSFGLFKKDFAAGMNVLVILVPQGMAYALLAGVPPIYGLYAGLVPLLLYALLGTSMHLSIGPAAISSLLLMEGISQVAEPETASFVKYVLLTGLIVGLLQLLFGIARLGFWIRFLSRPVIIGFTSAAAIIIGTSQFKYLLGFDIPRSPSLLETWTYVGRNLDQFHPLTFALCIGGLALIYLFRRIHRAIPGGLIAAVLAIAAAIFFKLDTKGVEIVGELPQGLPHFQLLWFSWADLQAVLPTAILLAFLSMVESVGIAKFWSVKSNSNYFDANKELIAYGISKIGGAFFQALPASGSNSRSAVNFQSGAQTQMSSIVSAVFMALTLLFFSQLFYYLPKAILASIILLAVTSLFSYREIRQLWDTHRPDFWAAVLTFSATIILGVRDGILLGVFFAVLTVLYQNARPHVALLGRLPDSQYYRNLERFPLAQAIPHCLIVRFDNALYYFNVLHFTDTLEELIDQAEDRIECVILDASKIHTVDSSGLRTLEQFQVFLSNRNITLYFCGLIGPARDQLAQNGLLKKIGTDRQFLTVHDAVLHYQDQTQSYPWKKEAVQTNIEKT